MKLGLIKWHKPNLLISKLTKKVSSNAIICSILLNEVEAESIGLCRSITIIYCNCAFLCFDLFKFLGKFRAESH